MDAKIRKEIMYNVIIGFGNNTNRIRLDDKLYIIDDRLKNRIRIKNIILIIGMLILTFVYNVLNDKNFGMKAAEASNFEIGNGFMLTIIFLGSVGFMAYLIPRLIIPLDLSKFKMEKFKDE